MSDVTHGGIREEELRALGFDPDGIVDLSANLHPAGPDAAVLAAARAARLDRYPPADAAPLRDAIAAARQLDPRTVLVTPGATAALHLLARASLRAADRALVVGPTFGEYRAAIEAAGGEAVELTAVPPDFSPDLAAVAEAGAPLFYLCQPNNPTGVHLERAAVERLLDALTPRQLLVLDAAYQPFVREQWNPDALVAAGRQVAVVHSMTKLHAIPGLRLGYVVAAPAVVQRLRRLQPSWAIDAASLAAGVVASGQHDGRVALLEETWHLRERLRDHCTSLGLDAAPGRANFLLVRTGDGAATRLRLLHHGLLVRDCASFGLPEWVRIAIPAARHLPALEAALRPLVSPDPQEAR